MARARTTTAVRAAIAALCLFGLLSGSGAVAGGQAAVTVSQFAFVPKTLTIAAGTTVEWTNEDDEPHTVVDGEKHLFKSPPLDTGERFSFVFTKPGTYTYYCSVHPHMTGIIVVQ